MCAVWRRGGGRRLSSQCLGRDKQNLPLYKQQEKESVVSGPCEFKGTKT
jgi:hypothetical protein